MGVKKNPEAGKERVITLEAVVCSTEPTVRKSTPGPDVGKAPRTLGRLATLDVILRGVKWQDPKWNLSEGSNDPEGI